jgi:hypothetical protein
MGPRTIRVRQGARLGAGCGATNKQREKRQTRRVLARDRKVVVRWKRGWMPFGFSRSGGRRNGTYGARIKRLCGDDECRVTENSKT